MDNHQNQSWFIFFHIVYATHAHRAIDTHDTHIITSQYGPYIHSSMIAIHIHHAHHEESGKESPIFHSRILFLLTFDSE